MATTSVAPSAELPTRRSVFGLVGLLAAGDTIIAAGAAVASATVVVDPHPAWEAEMRQLAALWYHCNPEWMALEEAKAQAVMSRFDTLQRWVFSQPPQTLGGAAAVIRAAVFVQRQFDSELTDDQLAALQRTATLVDHLAAGRA